MRKKTENFDKTSYIIGISIFGCAGAFLWSPLYLPMIYIIYKLVVDQKEFKKKQQALAKAKSKQAENKYASNEYSKILRGFEKQGIKQDILSFIPSYCDSVETYDSIVEGFNFRYMQAYGNFCETGKLDDLKKFAEETYGNTSGKNNSSSHSAKDWLVLPSIEHQEHSNNDLPELHLVVTHYDPWEKRLAIAESESTKVVIPWYVITESAIDGLSVGQLITCKATRKAGDLTAVEISKHDPKLPIEKKIFGDFQISINISGIDDKENIMVILNNKNKNDRLHSLRFFNQESEVIFNLTGQSGYYPTGEVTLRVDNNAPIKLTMWGGNSSGLSNEDLKPFLYELQGGQKLFFRNELSGNIEEGTFDISGIDNALALFAGRLRSGGASPYRVSSGLSS